MNAMGEKDLYEDLCKYYEFMGPLPRREEFKKVLRELVTPEDISVFFLIPVSGCVTLKKLKKKAKIPTEELCARLDRLVSEAFLLSYDTPNGPAYERMLVTQMTEQHVRKQEESPIRTFFAEFFNAVLEGSWEETIPTRTPYFRVYPAEGTPTTQGKPTTIGVDTGILDQREPLPFEVLSEVIKREEEWIGVTECYCRKAKQLVGDGCEHMLETCFVFNELAQGLIKTGIARKIDYQEAMEILTKCEEQGLVHNGDNCAENIRAICNCCPCSCGALKMCNQGLKNVMAPARYVVRLDVDKCTLREDCIACCPVHARSIQDGTMVVDTESCIGCGLCVTACPEGANRMTLRGQPPKIPRTWKKLYGKIGREAMFGIAKNKILGKRAG
jgi:Fe-S-cluster-containing hydrogenase component 2